MRLALQAGPIVIETLTDLNEKVQLLMTGPGVYRDWVYAPAEISPDVDAVANTLPFPSRVFGLKKTHSIRYDRPTDRAHLDFLVWCLGFFIGMRLTSSDAGYLDATPLKPNALTDFIFPLSSAPSAISLAEDFWKSRDGESSQLLVAIIHALFLAQNPRLLQYERFFHLYAAFDATYALMKQLTTVARAFHAGRLAAMCDTFGLNIPVWAKAVANESEVGNLRNQTFHEALFAGEPLGFAIYRGTGNDLGESTNMLLEMQALLCRFIVAVLGAASNEYVKSPITTRQLHLLRL